MSPRFRETWFRCVLVAGVVFLLTSAPGAWAQDGDPELRAKVEAFQQSLKAAWDADDREAVLTHFEHGDVLPPTRREYRMLGRMPFWDKPLKSVTRDADGVLRAAFVMDPESASPAQTMTLKLVEGPGGRLLVQSEATPEQLAEGRERAKAAARWSAELKALEAELLARPPLESELLALFESWFWRMMQAESEKANQPIPEGLRESMVLRALGEMRGADKAVLVLLMGATEGGRTRLRIGGVGFGLQDGKWEVIEDNLRRQDDVEGFLGDADIVLKRRATLSLERVPLFYYYARSELRERYDAATKAGDAGASADLIEQGMAGFPLANWRELERGIDDKPEEARLVRLEKHEVDDDGAIVALEVLRGRRSSDRVALRLAREGTGWVIAGPYVTPSDQTKKQLRELGSAIDAYKRANGALPPAGLEAAVRALVPAHAEKVQASDAWGTPLRYVVSDDGERYRVISAGADKAFDHADWDPAPRRMRDQESEDPDEDLVYENGRFARWHADGIW